MRKGIALAALLAGLGTLGCTTTTADRQWTADEPPPIQSNTRATTGPAVSDAGKLPAPQTRVSADDIDETTLADAVRKLEGEMNYDKRALSKAGR